MLSKYDVMQAKKTAISQSFQEIASLLFIYLFFSFPPRIEPRTSQMLIKHSTTEQHPPAIISSLFSWNPAQFSSSLRDLRKSSVLSQHLSALLAPHRVYCIPGCSLRIPNADYTCTPPSSIYEVLAIKPRALCLITNDLGS